MPTVSHVLVRRYPHIRFCRHWKITPEVHYQLGQCQAIISAIRDTPLLPKQHERLLSVSMIKGAQATTAIEGNTLTDAEVERVADGESLAPSKQYQQIEVRNILDAMNLILKEVIKEEKTGLVSRELILSFHKHVGRELGEHFDAIPGELRTDERFVGPYKCPRAQDVPRLVGLLCEWLQEEFKFTRGQTFETAVIQAIVTHVYVEWIHPFGDGNGRTGRLLEFYILLRAGNPDIASHILSNFYNLTRPEYYRQLDKAHKDRDLGSFITYAVQGYRDGLQESLKTIQQSQFEMAWRMLIYDRFAEVKYTKKNVFKRRRALMLSLPLDRPVMLSELPVLTTQLARYYSSLTDRTLGRDVRSLVEMGLVLRHQSVSGVYRAHTLLLRKQMPEKTIATTNAHDEALRLPAARGAVD